MKIRFRFARLFFALVPAAVWLAVAPVSAQPPPSQDAPADRRSPDAASEARPVPTDGERSMADELRARAEDIRRRNEESRLRDRARVDEERARERERAANRTGRAAVKIFGDASLENGERADAVVSVFGSATNDGHVADSVVSVFGNSQSSGPVGEAVVSVFGNATVTGPADEGVVTVFGNASINSRVGRVVVVFGNVELGPKAEVTDELVCIMGEVRRDPAAIVHQPMVGVGGGFGFNSPLGVWVTQCFLLGRPLAFRESVAWAWVVAGSFLLFYAFLAVLFGRGVEKGVATLETRPGASMLTAIASIVLTPVAVVLLIMTFVGILVVPFFAAGLFIAGLFGRAIVLAWLGRRLLKIAGADAVHPAIAVLLSGVLVLLLYTIPVLGFLTYKLIGWLGLGVVLYMMLAGYRARKAVPMAATAVAAATASAASTFSTSESSASSSAAPFSAAPEPASSGPGGFVPPAPPAARPSFVPPVVLPRAGFWIRFWAMVLDLFLLGVVAAFFTLHIYFAPWGVAAYTALMWKLKGTTIGGVICNLKVVRIDGREVDWTTAIVRSLGCFLSFAACGLGFIWVAVDGEKQSWHDKIAGTTVVRMPKGMSLL